MEDDDDNDVGAAPFESPAHRSDMEAIAIYYSSYFVLIRKSPLYCRPLLKMPTEQPPSSAPAAMTTTKPKRRVQFGVEEEKDSPLDHSTMTTASLNEEYRRKRRLTMGGGATAGGARKYTVR